MSRRALGRLNKALSRLPDLGGRPIRIRTLPALHAFRGRLHSGSASGTAVHAGTFLRRREIVLDGELLTQPAELTRIVIHEVFHFVWLRLGNARRSSFEALVEKEVRRGVRGELGWSAEWRKQALSSTDRRDRSRRWREYIGESFCDSAAWFYWGRGRHREFTLAPESRRLRRQWFREAGAAMTFSV